MQFCKLKPHLLSHDHQIKQCSIETVIETQTRLRIKEPTDQTNGESDQNLRIQAREYKNVQDDQLI